LFLLIGLIPAGNLEKRDPQHEHQLCNVGVEETHPATLSVPTASDMQEAAGSAEEAEAQARLRVHVLTCGIFYQ
jgi:hypothetical protein